MSWIENVRSKPTPEKIKIIWIVCGVVAFLLLVIWAIVGGLDNNAEKDLRLFKSLKQGVNDASSNFKTINPNN